MKVVMQAITDFDIKQVENTIMHAVGKGTKELAQTIADESKSILKEAVTANNGSWTGNLASAISAKSADTGQKNYIRWDIVVNTTRAPYAEWIEIGRYADALPYKSDKKRDYSKSGFTGYRYLELAVEKYAEKAPEFLGKFLMAELAKNTKSIKI